MIKKITKKVTRKLFTKNRTFPPSVLYRNNLQNRFLTASTSFFKITNPLFLAAFFFVLLCSCSRTPNSQATLRISFSSFPSSADPKTCGDVLSSSLCYLLYEGLLRSSPNKQEQGLAERIEISEDRLSYTFHLRSSFWSDGSPLSAKDFERSWKRILDSSFPGVWAHLLYPIKNAEKAYKGTVPLDEVGISALDNKTLRVTLERPTPYFLTLLLFPCYLPTPSSDEQTLNSTNPIVSNGPFCLEKAHTQSEIVLKKNALFWNKKEIHLSKIHISIIPQENTALRMFEKGELDLVGGVESPLPLDSIEYLKKRHLLSFSEIPATTFCSFNTQHPLLKNKNLRKALSYAIDRKSIVERIIQKGQNEATRPLPPILIKTAVAGTDFAPLIESHRQLYPCFNPKESQRFLRLALSELNVDRNALNQLVLSYSEIEGHEKIATALKEQWHTVLGISVALEAHEKQSLREQLFLGTYDLALYFWIAPFEDPIALLDRFQDPQNRKNVPHWSSEEFTALLTHAVNEKNPFLRFRILEVAEELLCEEMPLAPIHHWSCGWITHDSLHNVVSTPSGLIQFERIEKSNVPY